MEGSVNKCFTLKLSTTPSQSGESNENELNRDEFSSKLHHHPKKPPHFMSPTISAATKAAATVSRKKILAERNESSDFFDTHLPKFDSTTSDIKPRFILSSSSRLTPSKSCASVADDDEEQEICASDSSLKPYDPVTSYTSPRPKFLRYNPNRPQPQNENQKEDLGFDIKRTCLDYQKAAIEERAIADALDSVVSSPQKTPRKEEENEIDRSKGKQDSNLGELEEEEDDDEIEEIEKERWWSLKEILKFLLLIVALFFSTLYISSMNSPTPSPAVEALRGLKDGYYAFQNKAFEAVEFKIFEALNGTLYRGAETNADAELDKNIVEDEERGLVESAKESSEEVENVLAENLSENELEKNLEVFDQLIEVTEIAEDEVIFDHELESKVESLDHLVGEDLQEINEVAFSDQEIEKTVEGSDELMDIETVVGEEVVENETGIVEEINGNTLDEFGISQRKNEEEPDAISHKADSNEAITKPRKIESFPIYMIGVPMIIASFCLVYLWRHKKNTSIEDSSQHMKNPIAEPSATQCQEARSIAENISPVLDVEQEKKIKKVEFKAKPSPLIRSNEEETSKEFSHSQAPIVELLSELVIGEVSSSLKSKLVEIEESKNYVSQEKKRSNIKQLSSSVEFSTADSPSYGNFTPRKRIAKKEEAKDGEVNMLITTPPVRRSSRIRNRAVMSP